MQEQLTRYAQVSLPVEAELGRRMMSVREILSLSPGSLLALPTPAGSKATVLVGGASFCFGDMMRRGRSAAVRITGFESRGRR
jgi:flagellar motor switch protein FliN/FliY